MSNTMLKVEDLYLSFKTYEGIAKVLDGINFEVNKGEIFGIVGESGSGKSVTALTIMGLLPPNAVLEKGKVIFNGIDLISNKNAYKRIRGKEINMIFQNPSSSLNPVFKVKDQMLNVIMYHLGMEKEEAYDYAIDLLKKVELPDPDRVMESYPFELSGGMAQRVMIAMAISTKPKLLIADEPTTALDVTIQAQILKLLKRLRSELKLTIILITHDLSVVSYMCDRMAVFYAGQVMEIGPVKDVLMEPNNPYTKALMEAIPNPEYKGKPLPYIKGEVPSLVNPPTGCRFHPRCKYAMNICKEAKPKLVEVGEHHYSACWLNEEV